MTDLAPGMTVTVTIVHADVPAGPLHDNLPDGWEPYDGSHKILYGYTGRRGGPAGDHSRPWANYCICNLCIPGPGNIERLRAIVAGKNGDIPGQFIRASDRYMADTHVCQICRWRPGRYR